MKKQFFLVVLVSLAALVGGPGSILAQSRLTLAIECGAQGQVDDAHRLTVTVTNTSTNTDTTVTIPVQAQTDSSAIADTLATVLDKKGVSGTKKSETTNKRYTGSKHKAEDVILPAGYKVKKVKVEKEKGEGWECDDGHLQAYVGKKQVSNKALSSQVTPVGAAVGSVVIAPLPLTPFKMLDIEILYNDSSDLIYILDLYGSGGVSVYSFEKTFQAGTPPGQALQEVGTFLQNLGMLVIYTGTQSLQADLTTSGLSIIEGYFSAQAVEQIPFGESRTIEFSFDLN